MTNCVSSAEMADLAGTPAVWVMMTVSHPDESGAKSCFPTWVTLSEQNYLIALMTTETPPLELYNLRSRLWE
jgi:hypothetical protein